MIKKISFLLTVFMLLAVFGSPQSMMGQTRDRETETYTWIPSEHYSANTDLNNVPITLGDGVEAVFSKNTGSNPPKYYTQTSSCLAGVRLYTNNTFVVTPINSAIITEIKYTFFRNSNKAYLTARMTSNEGEYIDGGTPTNTEPVVDRWVGQTSKPVSIIYEGSSQRLLSKVEVTVTIGSTETWDVVYDSNNGSGEMHPDPSNPYGAGATVTALPNSFSYLDHVFDKWNTKADGTGVSYYPGNTFNIYGNMTLYAQWIDAGSGFIDVLNPTNVNEGMEQGSGYLPWSVTCSTGDFTTTYKGKSYRSDEYIQLNSTNSTASGVVTAISHGVASRVEVVWDNNTAAGRTLQVYGRNYPYQSTSELFAAATQGTLLGTIVKGTNTALDINGNFAYIGLRSANNAMYMDEIRITWAPSTDEPIIQFSPASIDLGNVVLGEECSATFVVSQSNLGSSIELTSQIGMTQAGSLVPSSIPNEANPTSVTWTYTPTTAGIMNANVVATATWDDRYTITATLPITANVLDPNAGILLSAAKSQFLNGGTASASIDLTNVEVIGQYGQYLYLQDAYAGLLVYGNNAPTFATGDKFTAGSLTGTFVNYNGVIEFTDFAFQNVQYTSGNDLTPVEVPSMTALLNDNNHTYEHRYVKINGITLNIDDYVWTLNGGTINLLMNDRFGINYANHTEPESNDPFVVKGMYNPYYGGGTMHKELDPTALTDIYTTVKAGNPTFNPEGGLTNENAVHTTTVTITPAIHTTLNYNYERDNRLQSNSAVTINIYGPTTIQAFATRDFYANSDDFTYYYTLPTGTKTVAFSINGVVSDQIYVENVLQSNQCPAVSPIGNFTFRGWSTSPNSTSTISLPYTVSNDITLYAVYGKAVSYSYNLLSSDDELGEGEYVIVGDNGRDQFALKNGETNYSPTAFTLASLNLTNNNGVLEGDGLPDVTWTFTGATTSSMMVTSTANGKYLYTTNNAQGVRVGNGEQTWYVSEDDRLTGRFNLKNNNTLRYLSLYNDVDWRSYLVGDMYNTNSYPGLILFKKTPLGAATDACFTRIFTDEYAESEIIINGPSVIPSGSFLNMGSHSFECNNAAWFIIEDGATFTPAANDPHTMKARVQKAIMGYGTNPRVDDGWYLLSSPVGQIQINNGTQSAENPSIVENIVNGEFDLYWFEQAADYEWRNYKANDNSIIFGDGESVLYASQTDRTLTFVGTLCSSFSGTLSLTGDSELSGMNLVGNPFTCPAYINCSASDYYRLVENEEVSELQAVQSSTPINAMEGVFVLANTDEETYSFTLNNRQQEGDGRTSGMLNIEVIGNKGTVIDQTRIRFGQGGMLDKFMLDGNSAKLSIPIGNKEYAVVRAQTDGEMPVNFKVAKDGSYTLKVDSDMEFDYLHLIDSKTGADINLLSSPSYIFEAKTNEIANRFKIVFHAKNANDDTVDELFAFFDGSDWVISNMGEAIMQVIDTQGRIVNSKMINGNVIVNPHHLSKGVYIMRLIKGESVKTQKVVVR